ncbi:MAG: hypothetical protein QM497_03340 [Sulfurimonas sp.]
MENSENIYDLKRIQKNCFWDYTFLDEQLLKMANSDDAHEVNFLFNKIFANSTRVEWDLYIFPKDVIIEKLKAYKPPRFNNKYFNYRLAMLKFIFGLTDKPPKGLEWEVDKC